MPANDHTKPTLENQLAEISRGLRHANRKLDRMIYLVEDGYHRAFYEAYGHHPRR